MGADVEPHPPRGHRARARARCGSGAEVHRDQARCQLRDRPCDDDPGALEPPRLGADLHRQPSPEVHGRETQWGDHGLLRRPRHRVAQDSIGLELLRARRWRDITLKMEAHHAGHRAAVCRALEPRTGRRAQRAPARVGVVGDPRPTREPPASRQHRRKARAELPGHAHRLVGCHRVRIHQRPERHPRRVSQHRPMRLVFPLLREPVFPRREPRRRDRRPRARRLGPARHLRRRGGRRGG